MSLYRDTGLLDRVCEHLHETRGEWSLMLGEQQQSLRSIDYMTGFAVCPVESLTGRYPDFGDPEQATIAANADFGSQQPHWFTDYRQYFDSEIRRRLLDGAGIEP